MKRIKLALVILATALAYGYQGPNDGEPTGTDTCNNYRNNPNKCRCGRAMMCGRNGHGSGDPDAYLEGPNKCQKSCRKDLCKCISPCTSRGNR